ncbi:hypothetical protein, partial [Pseudomonas syringae]|uniref:hypothetical protein n=1 Tax=Pseudomonas syringae TaxID=317 RepID=UPI001F2781CE
SISISISIGIDDVFLRYIIFRCFQPAELIILMTNMSWTAVCTTVCSSNHTLHEFPQTPKDHT